MQNFVREIRKNRGLTLDQVAARVGATKAQLSKLERGITRLSDYWLERLAAVLQCSIHDLIDDEKKQNRLSTLTPMNLPEGRVKGISVPVKGVIETRQAGLVEYAEQASSTLWVPMPHVLLDLQPIIPIAQMSFFALSARNSGFLDIPEGAVLLFVTLSHREMMQKLVTGSVVVVSCKDDQGRRSNDFLRLIERDSRGASYVVYRVQHGRSSVTTIAKTLLSGQSSFEDLVRFQQEADHKKEKEGGGSSEEIKVGNRSIYLKAMLVAVLYDFLPGKG